MKLLGKVICAVTRKHKRGKKLATHKDGIRPGFDKFECPRCGAQWQRKARNAQAA